MQTESNWWASQAPGSGEPTYAYPITMAQGRVKGGVSEFRNGQVTLTPRGVVIRGKAVPTGGASVASAFLLGAILTEYAMRHDKTVELPWDSVEDIVLEPAKNRVCIVYRRPEAPKRFTSMGFKTSPELYANFVQAARYFAASKVRDGKIGPATPIWAWAVLAVFIILVVVAISLPDH